VIIASGIAMQFGARNRYGLLGANDCGKSTFMKIMGEVLHPFAGSVVIKST
jgi:ATPase subunit of ABC transporter with duplicated ATPase domains